MAAHVQDARKFPPHGAKMQIRPFVAQHWKGLIVALVLALFGAFLGSRLLGEGRETRALLRMPAEQRRVLYERTLQSTQSLCAQAETDGALVERCVDSAQFLLAFPECDGACQALASAHRHGPTR